MAKNKVKLSIGTVYQKEENKRTTFKPAKTNQFHPGHGNSYMIVMAELKQT